MFLFNFLIRFDEIIIFTGNFIAKIKIDFIRIFCNKILVAFIVSLSNLEQIVIYGKNLRSNFKNDKNYFKLFSLYLEELFNLSLDNIEKYEKYFIIMGLNYTDFKFSDKNLFFSILDKLLIFLIIILWIFFLIY